MNLKSYKATDMKKTNIFYIWWRTWQISIVLLTIVFIEMIQLLQYGMEKWFSLVPLLLLFTTLMHADYIRQRDILLSKRYAGSREAIMKQVWISVFRPSWIGDKFLRWYGVNSYWLKPFLVGTFLLGFIWFPLKEQLIGFIWFAIWLFVFSSVAVPVGIDLMLTSRSIGRVRDIMYMRGYTNYTSLRMIREEAEHLGLIS